MNHKIKLIIDTDIGNDIDDTWAIVYALLRDRFDVKAICVTGCEVEYKARLVAKLLTRLNRTDVAIVRGVNFGAPFSPQEAWISDFLLSEFKGKVIEDARAGFEKILSADPDTIVVGLAPNGTLAYVRDILERKKAKIVAMAGSVFKGYFGSPFPVPECNVVTDVGASSLLYQSDLDYVMLPLDVCGELVLDGENYARIRTGTTAAARAVVENYFVWDRDYEGGAKKYDTRKSSTVLYDMIPFWYLEYPDLLEIKRMRIGLDERGVTVEKQDGLEMTVATDIRGLDFLYAELTETLIG